ncbi:3632_t:CDS:2 [Funneliformis geosporum]|uniref:11396_t:CDS:1 n=1 Tax=Funneliformis geosporum TaxID=1117311 RepID=A0A9W4SUW4_9GLOM|nr:11396_t:CDS:2 [Funneliformis geosporum]CAI2181635.1 3632_t:CDS:2 [Funneliformis geosporum]
MPLQQIVLHPTVNNSIKYASTTVGRDKVYKAVQFFSRFLVWYFKRQGYDKTTIQRYNNLKSTLGISRKLMRFGKPVEHLQHATKALNEVDEITKFTTIAQQLGYATYLFWDTFVWAHNAGVYKFQQIKRINENAHRFWFIGLVFSIIHGLYKLYLNGYQHNFMRQVSKARFAESSEKSNVRSEAESLMKERKAVIIQLVQDVLDITIPATALGYLHLEDGLVGLAGFISSIMGIQSQWKKVNSTK